MTPRRIRYSHYVLHIAVAALISICCLQPVSGQIADADADAHALDNWRSAMAHNTQLGEGCFRAAYPSIIWKQVECKKWHPRVHPRVSKPSQGQIVGNGDDYVAEAPGLITETVGTFPTVTDVKAERSVGVPEFGDGGILGSNEYSLQLNTNFGNATAACAGGSEYCFVWQQFIYATDYAVVGEAAVFMQNWLIEWGDSPCPSGFASDGEGDCYGNSNYVSAPDVVPSSLGSLSLSGAVAGSGNDTVIFIDGSTAYSVTEPDSTLDISQVWQYSEFNVVGDAGGSRADFNKLVSITVQVALTDGTTSAPTCLANGGTTGETNNLNLGTCSIASGSSPYIQFTESNY